MTLRIGFILILLLGTSGMAIGQPAAGTLSAGPSKAASAHAASGTADHAKEDIKRHRQIATAHEAAAQCREAGKPESTCMAELAKACKGIAFGKYCGMRHAD